MGVGSVVRVRLKKLNVRNDFLFLGICTINVFQHSTTVGYSVHWKDHTTKTCFFITSYEFALFFVPW